MALVHAFFSRGALLEPVGGGVRGRAAAGTELSLSWQMKYILPDFTNQNKEERLPGQRHYCLSTALAVPTSHVSTLSLLNSLYAACHSQGLKNQKGFVPYVKR